MSFMDINLTGAAFSDYQVTDVGAGTWQLEHDWFTRQDLVIRTAAGGGGTLLVEGTDYTLSQESTELSQRVSEAVGAGRNVFHLVAVINVAYQTGSLYVSGKYIADSNAGEDVEYRRIKAVSNADYTVRDDDGFGTIAVNPSSADRTVTLPTVADNANRELTIINTGTGAYKVIVDGEGAELINDVATWDLFTGQTITIKSNGSKWLAVAGNIRNAYAPVAGEPSVGTLHWIKTASRPDSWDVSAAAVDAWTTYTCTKIPTGSKAIRIRTWCDRRFLFRAYGDAADGDKQSQAAVGHDSASGNQIADIDVPVSSDLKIEYKRGAAGSGTLSFAERGYWI